MPSEQQSLLMTNPPVVFGPRVVSRKALVDWALRDMLALPPTDPDIFEFRLIHIDSLLSAIERGAGSGDAEHVVRAAKALVEADQECDEMLANRVRYRDVSAARGYLATRGVSLWASRLKQAIPERLQTSELKPERGLKGSSKPAAGELTGSALLVLSSLREAGFEPEALPPSQPGFMNPAKVAARDAALKHGVNADDFEKAWKLLQRRNLVRPVEDRSTRMRPEPKDGLLS